MLFKIETPGGKASESYLFGTLHVNQLDHQIGQEICRLPKEVKDAFEKARCYAFEADVTKSPDTAQIIDAWFQKTEHTNPGWFEAFVS